MPKSIPFRTVPGSRQSGAGMIEVMVSCLVLSVGLLALSAIQSKALVTFSQTSVQAGLTQVLHSWNEARLLSSFENSATGQTCREAGSVLTKSAEQTFFSTTFGTSFTNVCSTNFTLSENWGTYSATCPNLYNMSRNVYCESPTLGIFDLRNPVWMP